MCKLRLLAAMALLATSGAIQAANFSFTGLFTRDDDVQFFSFSVGAPSSVTFRTYSYAGGTNAAGTVIPRGGFDPVLAVFGSTGALIGQNDDGAGVPTDLSGAAYDTLLTLNLAAGAYWVSVMQYHNFANGPTLFDGFMQSGNFTAGFGCAAGIFCDVSGNSAYNSRTGNWAFDILNVADATTTVIPVPAALPLMLGGLGLLAWVARRRGSAA
jgi:hypothetical protein